MEPGEARARVMSMATGAWVSQALSSITRLDVPDLIQRDGPLSARLLVQRYGVDAQPEFLERVLRACASIGVFTEDSEGRFGATPLSAALTLESPVSVKHFVELYGGDWWKLFTGLPDAIRTGRPQGKAQLGREAWEDDPEKSEDFGAAMRSRPDPARGMVEQTNLSEVRNLVDVGGGFGHVAIALLKHHPQLRATVLDLPQVASIAERHAAKEPAEVLERLGFVGQDMFGGVPAADAYLLSGVIHDWDDESCARVLSNCLAGLSPGGRVFCVDAVLPPLGDTGAVSAKFLDLLMMVSLPGKERSEVQWRALLAEAGLAVASITAIRGSDLSIIEGRPRS